MPREGSSFRTARAGPPLLRDAGQPVKQMAVHRPSSDRIQQFIRSEPPAVPGREIDQVKHVEFSLRCAAAVRRCASGKRARRGIR